MLYEVITHEHLDCGIINRADYCYYWIHILFQQH